MDTVASRSAWDAVRQRRVSDPGSVASYRAAKLALELGAQVRRLRLSRGWSQLELSEHAGMSRSAVARLETGGSVPTLAALERLAEALSVELRVSLRKH